MSQFQSTTTPRFWKLFAELPAEVQSLAFEKYELFKQSPYHRSLGFQAKGKAYTVEIGRSHIDLEIFSHDSGSGRTKITIAS